MTHCTERLLSLFCALWKDYSVFLWDRYWEFGVNGVLGQFKPKLLTAFQCLPDSSFLFALFLSHPSSVICFWCENQCLQRVSKRYRYLKKHSDNRTPVCVLVSPVFEVFIWAPSIRWTISLDLSRDWGPLRSSAACP